jgi:uncharacterized membrane protein
MILIILLAVHLLAALFWVGGMAFAHFILRPAALPLDPPLRLPLWRRVFERFFPAVGIAAILLLASGIAMVVMDFGGFANAALYISLMMAIGIVMMLLFGHLYFALWPRFRQAVDAGRFPDAANALGKIRRTVTINLALGVITVIIGGTGRYW